MCAVNLSPSTVTTVTIMHNGSGISEAQGRGGNKATITNCAALGGGLGALAGVMFLGLVGVVLGWVWSCHRSREKSTITER